MLFVLSPAKSLDWSPTDLHLPTTTPALQKDFSVLMRRSKRLKSADLKSLMGISDALAILNHTRFQDMAEAPDGDRDRPAALAFNGDVYRGLDARTLTAEQLDWAQSRLNILSGLYGVLRPLDLIQPHRMEMGTRLKTRRGASLYDFWGDRVTAELNRRLKDAGSDVVINLASHEYARVVRPKALRATLITPIFKERMEDGSARIISFYAKWARGAMVRWAIENKVERAEDLQHFNTGDYQFQPDASSDGTLVFCRPKPPLATS